MNFLNLRAGALALLLLSSLEAQVVNLGASLGPGTGIANARYRIHASNWDMALTRAAINSAADVLGVNLGNEAALSGDAFSFVLENRAGQGLVWSLGGNSDPNGPAGGLIGWGVFDPPLTAPNVLSAQISGLAPDFSYNYLNLELRARAAGSSMSLSNLHFISAAATAGTLDDVTVNAPSSPPGEYVRSLWSDTDFSTFDWILTGTVQGISSGNTIDEGVVFNIKMAQIPEPAGSAAVLAVAVLWAVRRARGRSRAVEAA